MKATSIIWRRTFPECEPGTDGVAIFEGRIIGRVRYHQLGPRDPVWLWSVTDLETCRPAGLGERRRPSSRHPFIELR